MIAVNASFTSFFGVPTRTGYASYDSVSYASDASHDSGAGHASNGGARTYAALSEASFITDVSQASRNL
jgi:hypothetical protein